MGAGVTVADRLGDLKSISDIDDMLIEGSSAPDVAKFIHIGLKRLEDVPEVTLVDALKARRTALREEQDEDFPARNISEDSTRARAPGKLARSVYFQMRRQMDEMIELECLFLSLRDRIDALVEKEAELGVPFEHTHREYLAAAKLLREYREARIAMEGHGGMDEVSLKLSVRGYSQRTRAVLAKPEARRRVFSVIERLSRIAGGRDIPELVGDAEASEVTEVPMAAAAGE
jgi:hypothetical protein